MFSLFKSQPEPSQAKTPMQARLFQQIEELTKGLPLVAQTLLNQYLPLLVDNMGDDDARIVDSLNGIRRILDYIETGGVDGEQPEPEHRG